VGGVKWEYGVIALYGTDILLCGMLFLALLISKKNIDLRFMIYEKNPLSWILNLKSKIKNHTSETLLVAFLSWAGLSIFWSSGQVVALYFFVKLLLAIGRTSSAGSRKGMPYLCGGNLWSDLQHFA
jgi:hypothetical protein